MGGQASTRNPMYGRQTLSGFNPGRSNPGMLQQPAMPSQAQPQGNAYGFNGQRPPQENTPTPNGNAYGFYGTRPPQAQNPGQPQLEEPGLPPFDPNAAQPPQWPPQMPTLPSQAQVPSQARPLLGFSNMMFPRR